ncbi:hypothetical protein [Candidatus Entotheonella palauensis]|uniref:hypothetical protein n=1 Tax=Candidatus Entotheonella palauensis TaxID=93172 RepID=UPI000B7ECB4F|nr:hypothetical protein [Candidatus Entotheonella palauensis]
MDKKQEQVLQEALHTILALYKAEEEARAWQLARAAVPQALALDTSSEAAWQLAELLVLLGDDRLGRRVAMRQAEMGASDEALVHFANLLARADHQEKAAELLRKIVAERGVSLPLVGGLVELALMGLGWQVLHDLELSDPDILAIPEGVRLRASDFDLASLDQRRHAYMLARVVVLGASEDEGDHVQPYWFLSADEFETAWILRRLITWMHDEAIEPTSVRAGDPAAQPIALALGKCLNVPFRRDPPEVPGGVRVFSTLQTLREAGAASPHDVLTFCLGIAEAPGWQEVITPSPVDVVGLFAALEVSWADVDRQGARHPNGVEDGQGEVKTATPPEVAIAEAILAEAAQLPEDLALPKVLQFYRAYTARVRITTMD